MNKTLFFRNCNFHLKCVGVGVCVWGGGWVCVCVLFNQENSFNTKVPISQEALIDLLYMFFMDNSVICNIYDLQRPVSP